MKSFRSSDSYIHNFGHPDRLYRISPASIHSKRESTVSSTSPDQFVGPVLLGDVAFEILFDQLLSRFAIRPSGFPCLDAEITESRHAAALASRVIRSIKPSNA